MVVSSILQYYKEGGGQGRDWALRQHVQVLDFHDPAEAILIN